MCCRVSFMCLALLPILPAVFYCYLSDIWIRSVDDCYTYCQEPARTNIGAVKDYNKQSNLVADVIFQMLRGYLKKNNYDPAKLDDFHYHTTEKALGQTINIHIDATSLELRGFSNFQKMSEFEVLTSPNNMVKLKGYISMSDLYLKGDCKVEAAMFTITMSSLNIETLQLYLEIDFPRSDYGMPVARILDIHHIGKVTAESGNKGVFSGLFAGVLGRTIRQHKDTTIKQVVVPELLKQLNYALNALADMV